MTKGLFGVFISFAVVAAIVGFMAWDQTGRSQQMVVEADQLETLIDQQRAADLSYSYGEISEIGH